MGRRQFNLEAAEAVVDGAAYLHFDRSSQCVDTMPIQAVVRRMDNVLYISSFLFRDPLWYSTPLPAAFSFPRLVMISGRGLLKISSDYYAIGELDADGAAQNMIDMPNECGCRSDQYGFQTTTIRLYNTLIPFCVHFTSVTAHFLHNKVPPGIRMQRMTTHSPGEI